MKSNFVTDSKAAMDTETKMCGYTVLAYKLCKC